VLSNVYGTLCSVRQWARKTDELINGICVAISADRIVWASEREVWNYFERAGKPHVLFRRRGNKYADWLELMSNDVAALEQIRSRFPLLFKADVKKAEGTI